MCSLNVVCGEAHNAVLIACRTLIYALVPVAAWMAREQWCPKFMTLESLMIRYPRSPQTVQLHCSTCALYKAAGSDVQQHAVQYDMGAAEHTAHHVTSQDTQTSDSSS